MEKKNKSIITIIFTLVIIIIMVLTISIWNIATSGKEFKVTVLNKSGGELYVYIFVFNNTENYSDVEVTTNGLDNDASRTFIFKPLCENPTVLVETRTGPPSETLISHAFHYFYNNELYDLQVLVKDYGENINITKKALNYF